jgi:hypothetical protein
MGFDAATIEYLLSGRRRLPLERVLTIGRQQMAVTKGELRALLRTHGLEPGEAAQLLENEKGFCEPFLRKIGAGHVDSLDVSPFEGATILQDMNEPLSPRLRERFSLVIDGGSLEHVFHFTVALKNVMEAVEPGGSLMTITPANNLMGHGFYQFSPELFFRAFVPQNGFELARIFIYEQPWKGVWYEVRDPEEVRARVELVNRRPAYLLVTATRTSSVPIFATAPQQSDYSALWRGDSSAHSATPWKKNLPAWVGASYRGLRRTLRPFRPRDYRKVKGQVFG